MEIELLCVYVRTVRTVWTVRTVPGKQLHKISQQATNFLAWRHGGLGGGEGTLSSNQPMKSKPLKQALGCRNILHVHVGFLDSTTCTCTDGTTCTDILDKFLTSCADNLSPPFLYRCYKLLLLLLLLTNSTNLLLAVVCQYWPFPLSPRTLHHHPQICILLYW